MDENLGEFFPGDKDGCCVEWLTCIVLPAGIYFIIFNYLW